MRAGTFGDRVARGATGLRDWARSLSNRARIASLDRADAQDRAMAAKLAPTARERHDELIRFYDRYENLVETLCDAAQVGLNPKFEGEYAELRRWMLANYAPVRRYVVAYLRYTPEDAQHAFSSGNHATDAFEALFAAPTLEDFLLGDDGCMIDRITRTREALNLYGEHLRQLLARG